MTVLQEIAGALIRSAKDQGHLGADQAWGYHEVLARVAVETLKERFPGTNFAMQLDIILRGSL